MEDEFKIDWVGVRFVDHEENAIEKYDGDALSSRGIERTYKRRRVKGDGKRVGRRK